MPASPFVLIPGAGGSSWYWHRLVPVLERHGHACVTPDLPAADPGARLADYVQTILRATEGATGLVVVGQSMGGLSAPIVAERSDARLLVLLAAMIPLPGETGGDWWQATGQPRAAAEAARAAGRSLSSLDDPVAMYLHDLPDEVLRQALARPTEQTSSPFMDPWPLRGWPRVPTKVIACRNDRLFPLEFMRRVSRERLGIDPDVLDTGHLAALADPEALAQLLLSYLDQVP